MPRLSGLRLQHPAQRQHIAAAAHHTGHAVPWRPRQPFARPHRNRQPLQLGVTPKARSDTDQPRLHIDEADATIALAQMGLIHGRYYVFAPGADTGRSSAGPLRPMPIWLANSTGKTSLVHALIAISATKKIVSDDSVLMHVAAAFLSCRKSPSLIRAAPCIRRRSAQKPPGYGSRTTRLTRRHWTVRRVFLAFVRCLRPKGIGGV